MIICDIDGVVCDNRVVRSFAEWEKLMRSLEPNTAFIKLLTPSLKDVMFVTARSERYRERTMAWFQIHWPLAIDRSMGFHFRPEGDFSSSDEVKLEILKGLSNAGYPMPTLAIDDITDNIAMFQNLGIPTMQHLMPGAFGSHDPATPEGE